MTHGDVLNQLKILTPVKDSLPFYCEHVHTSQENFIWNLQHMWNVYFKPPAYTYRQQAYSAFYAPQLWRSWWGILVLGCLCVRGSVCSSRTVHARILKFHLWIPHGKIADTFVFLSELSPFLELCPLKKSEWNLVSKISPKVFELGTWNLVSW